MFCTRGNDPPELARDELVEQPVIWQVPQILSGAPVRPDSHTHRLPPF
jgi:hypothetical protein